MKKTIRQIGYFIYKIRRTPYSDYFFMDFSILVISLGILVLNIILFFPRPLTLNIVNIPSIDIQRKVIDALLKTLSIFFGITFSFLVLSFNIFYKNFGRYVFLEFFKSRLIKQPFTLLLCSICFLMYSMSYLEEAQSDIYSNSLYFLSIVFSLISFLWLFPSLVLQLRKAQSPKNIKMIIERFGNEPDIEQIEVRFLGKEHDTTYKDPFILLTEIGNMAIKEFDDVRLSAITNETCKYFELCTEIQNENERKEKLRVYVEITDIFLRLFQLAVKERNTIAAIKICTARFNLETFVLQNLDKIPFRDYQNRYLFWNLQNDVEQYFGQAIIFNEDVVCKRILENLRDFIYTAIPILVPIGYKCNNAFSDTEASAISSSFGKITALNEQILYYKKRNLHQIVNNTFYTLFARILECDFEASGKNCLLTVLINNQYECFEGFVKNKETYSIASLEIPFWRSIDAVIDCNYDYCFRRLLDATNLLFYNNQLNNIFLNKLKAEMLHAIGKVNTHLQLVPVILMGINKFQYLRNLIDITDNDYRKEIYIKLEMYLKIVQNETVEKAFHNEDIKNKLTEVLSNFPHLEAFKKQLQNKGYIYDDRIV